MTHIDSETGFNQLPRTFSKKTLVFLGETGSGKSTLTQAFSQSRKDDEYVRGFVKMFGKDFELLQDLYASSDHQSLGRVLSSNLGFILDLNEKAKMVERPVIKKTLYRSHPMLRMGKEDVEPTGYESTGAEWRSFSANLSGMPKADKKFFEGYPATQQGILFDTFEIGGTLNVDRKDIEAWNKIEVSNEKQKRILDNYVQVTLDWYDKFRTGNDGEPGCFQKIRKHYQLPKDSKVVCFLDLVVWTENPVDESDYLVDVKRRMDSFKSYYGEFDPVFLVVKTDYLLDQRTRDSILQLGVPKNDGLARLVKAGFSEAQSVELQKSLLNPTRKTFRTIYDKLQETLSCEIPGAKIVGGGSNFEPGHYKELLASIAGIVNG